MVQAATESSRIMAQEPYASAVLFAVVALLLAASALLSHASQRLRLPVGLVFLAIGIGAGRDGLGHIVFDGLETFWPRYPPAATRSPALAASSTAA